MEATEKRQSQSMRRLLGTRSGTLALAAGVAVLAGLVLLVFLSQYKDSVRGGAVPTTALVANSLIPKGTSGDIVIGQRLSKPTSVPTDERKDGTLTDTEAIAGQVAVRDIYPGQQITAGDFAGTGADPVRGQLTGDQRAVGVPVDGAHGLVGEIRRGDRVDVYAGFNGVSQKNGSSGPILRTLVQNVLVLAVPDIDGGGLTGGTKTENVTIRVTDRQAAAIAFAADNGKVWFSLRPPAGASDTTPAVVNLSALLAGSTPIDTEEAR